MFGKINKRFRLGVFLFAVACLAVAPVLSQAFEPPNLGSQWSQAQSGDVPAAIAKVLEAIRKVSQAVS